MLNVSFLSAIPISLKYLKRPQGHTQSVKKVEFH